MNLPPTHRLDRPALRAAMLSFVFRRLHFRQPRECELISHCRDNSYSFSHLCLDLDCACCHVSICPSCFLLPRCPPGSRLGARIGVHARTHTHTSAHTQRAVRLLLVEFRELAADSAPWPLVGYIGYKNPPLLYSWSYRFPGRIAPPGGNACPLPPSVAASGPPLRHLLRTGRTGGVGRS